MEQHGITKPRGKGSPGGTGQATWDRASHAMKSNGRGDGTKSSRQKAAPPELGQAQAPREVAGGFPAIFYMQQAQLAFCSESAFLGRGCKRWN